MTRHVVQLPNPDESLLLRELNHRIRNELNSAIYAISAKAMESDSVAVKTALLDVVELLHQCADVHRALHMPDQGASPMPRGTSSSFASLSRNTDWTAWRYVSCFQRMICGLKENAAGSLG